MKVHLYPQFSGVDEGDGGVRRVVEGQRASFPRVDVNLVDDPGDADLIACHIAFPPAYLKRFPDKPMVAHCHGLYWSEYQWENWAYRANADVLNAIMAADAVTAPSDWVARTIGRHTYRDVRVIPHGISLRDWRPGEHHQYVLWNKTRLDPVCTVEDLRPLAMALPDIDFITTYIDGDAPPNVQVTGRVPFDMAKKLVRGATVYLCTTRETFGIGTLEAMACGVPVVGYDFGGQAEFVEHGKEGWLVEPGDVGGLAAGIRWAWENREVVGAAAREKAAQFTWANAAAQYRDLYKEVIERHASQDKSPRVSVIVTAYKLEKYLPDALDSVISQTEKNWECIVVDDASPDRCGEIADEYAGRDKRIKVIHNAENLYLAGARNAGIERAAGRYIMPLDADDKLPPRALAILADALDAGAPEEEMPKLDVVYGNVLFTNEDGQTPTDYGLPQHGPGHSGWPMDWDPAKQIKGFNLLPYASMYRREAWRLTGGYRSRLRTAEDADFWTRLASYGFRGRRVTSMDTLIYRNREGSMSRTNNDQRMDYHRWFPWAMDDRLQPAGMAGAHAVSLSEPRVSVVIPVGPGHEALVYDAIDSVVAQSYPNWECIVVNDTGRPLHLPSFVRVIDCNGRDPGKARNLGVAAARTRLYLPLDADDYLLPDALQWLLTAFVERGEGETVIYPDFFEDPEQQGNFRPFELPDWSCDKLRRSVHAVTALTPVSVWKKVGGYAESLGWEDWDFQLRCAEAGICSHRLAAPLFVYRKWTGYRRGYDDAEFERRKAEMVGRWNPYFVGEKQFMACGCSSQTINPGGGNSVAQQMQNGAHVSSPSAEGAQVEYIGARAGRVSFRGQSSGTVYYFAAGDPPKWVLFADLPSFQNRNDFRVVGNVTAGSPALAVHA